MSITFAGACMDRYGKLWAIYFRYLQYGYFNLDCRQH